MNAFEDDMFFQEDDDMDHIADGATAQRIKRMRGRRFTKKLRDSTSESVFTNVPGGEPIKSPTGMNRHGFDNNEIFEELIGAGRLEGRGDAGQRARIMGRRSRATSMYQRSGHRRNIVGKVSAGFKKPLKAEGMGRDPPTVLDPKGVDGDPKVMGLDYFANEAGDPAPNLPCETNDSVLDPVYD